MTILPKPNAIPERRKGLLEKDVEERVVQYARSKGFWTRKFVSPANRGAPDRIFKIAGIGAFFIEFKRPGKAVKFPSNERERAQHREHERIRDAGALVFVIDDVNKGKALIDQALEAQ